MISCCDWWPWTKPGYITMIRRQSNNQWSGNIAAQPAPKIPCAKIRWKSSRLDFFWIKRASSSFIIFQTINTEYYSSLPVQLKDILKEKRRGKVTKRVFFLHDSAPAHRALATQEKLAYLGFQFLDHPPCSLDLARRTTTCSLYYKKNWNVTIFRPTRSSLLPQRPGWTDNLLIFFLSGLEKLEKRAKKCIELRGEYVE